MGVGKVSVILAVLVALSVLTVVVSRLVFSESGAGDEFIQGGPCPPPYRVRNGNLCRRDYQCAGFQKCCPSLGPYSHCIHLFQRSKREIR
ncbi:hypothetical protein Pmani_006236 [Petrolisthes manimaculis]|uniref:WAP domain-containing protein n=1 Tax=Petrolisthes manimaculis TaxID=1843537 RepID=A0AAE1QDC7_9EUCA|nr:hypothetical protein Pmani_006236 [Petrolisthes manimaculis]